MKVGAFELNEPLPELRNAQAFAMLSPWIDVGGVGSSTLRSLETHFKASEMGKLSRPGMFYDFTRYRPVSSLVEGRRVIKIPNTVINYSRREDGDFVFLHFLEPHAMGEAYVDSVLRVLEKLGVTRYFLIGGMYDAVPHTRPLVITGSASGGFEGKLREAGVKDSGYQGPTTINILITDEAPKRGIETMISIVHLPHYAQLEEDYSGQHALLSLVCQLFGLSVNLDRIKQMGEEQYRRINQAVEADPDISELVRAMEESYDEGAGKTRRPERMPLLSPEIERFLREMEKRFESD